MGVGPAVAIPKAVAQAGLELGDIDVFEINEAFASQVGQAEWGRRQNEASVVNKMWEQEVSIYKEVKGPLAFQEFV